MSSSAQQPQGDRPTLGVVYDLGSAGPGEIRAASRDTCDVVFICDRSAPHVAAQAGLIAAFGRVCDITGASMEEASAAVVEAGVSHLVTFSELQMRTTAEIADRAGLAYHSMQTVDRLTDKLEQRAVLARAGVQTTRSQAAHNADGLRAAIAEIGLPAVVKPRRGVGSIDTFRIDTPEQALALVEQIAFDPRPGAAGPPRAFVVEELLQGDPSVAGPQWGDYVSVESVVHAGEAAHVCVTGKLPLADPFRETGMVLPATLGVHAADQAKAATSEALDALGIHTGVTHTELKLTAEGPKIIEVNGRMGGYVAELLRRSTGFDLIQATLRNAVGQPIAAIPTEYHNVVFHYYPTPPVGARRIERLAGADQVRRLPGVRHLHLTAAESQEVDWRRGTQGYLGIVYGEASTHEEALDVVRAVDEALSVVYEWGQPQA